MLKVLNFLVFTLGFAYVQVVSAEDIVIGSSKQLKMQIKKMLSETIARDDVLTLRLDEINLSKGLNDGAVHILELEAELLKTDGSTERVSTVSKATVEALDLSVPLKNIEYSELLSDQPLNDVEKIKVVVIARPLPDKPSKILFQKLARLFHSATLNDPTIDTVRSIIPSNDDDTINFSASFLIPSNFFEYNRIKNETERPLLKPGQSFSIPFKTSSSKLPDSLWKNIANFVHQDGVFKSDNDIGGYVTFSPSKTPLSRIDKTMISEFKDISVKLVTADTDTKLDLRPTILPRLRKLEAVNESEYQKNNDDRTYFSIQMTIHLLRVYSDFLWDRKDNTVIYNSFLSWFKNAKQNSAINDFYELNASDIYDKIDSDSESESRIVPLYLPVGFPDRQLEYLLNIQTTIHRELNKQKLEEKAAWFDDVTFAKVVN